MSYFNTSIMFDTPDKANDFVKNINEILTEYGFVSVADVYDAVGLNSCYDDSLKGWTDLSDMKTTHNVKHDCMEIQMPEPTPLKLEEPIETFEDFGEESSMVEHPGHYQSETGLEVWDVIEAFTFDLKGVEAFDTGNIIKYICRWNKKNGLQDLEKAMCYLEHLINHVKNIEKENDLS